MKDACAKFVVCATVFKGELRLNIYQWPETLAIAGWPVYAGDWRTVQCRRNWTFARLLEIKPRRKTADADPPQICRLSTVA
jgi:hypothetical protein